MTVSWAFVGIVIHRVRGNGNSVINYIVKNEILGPLEDNNSISSSNVDGEMFNDEYSI